MKKLEALQEAYFNRLEKDGIEFYDFEDIGNRQSEAVLKSEYDVTPREMFEYLGTPEWMTDWGVEMIKEEENEKKNRKQFIKEFNEKVEKRAEEVRFMMEQTGLALNYN